MTDSKNNLCVAMVTDDFLPAKTGVGVHVQEIAQELIRRGHRVVVITSRRKGQAVFEEWQGVRIYRGWSLTIAGYPQALPRRSTLQRMLLAEGVDVVHFHYLGLLMWQGIMAARELGLKTLYTAHMSVDLLVQPFFMKPLLPLFTRLYFVLLEKVEHVLCPSEVQTRQVIQFTAHPEIHRVSNPIEFSGHEVPDATRPDRFVVLFVGRLSPEKNLGYLLDAFEKLLAVQSQAELWIAGHGVQEAELKRSVRSRGLEDQVSFKGQVPHEQLPALYAACDVFFLPSLREVLALVALEAMRFSRPVIVTNRIICAHELVEDGVNGWIVNAAQPQDAADKLIRLDQDRALAKRMGAKGFERSLPYTLARVGDHLERLYLGHDAASAADALPDTSLQVARRHTCVFCKRGKFSDAHDSGVFPADSRNLPDEFFRMWRCPVCISLHSLVPFGVNSVEKSSPLLRRHLNPFNRKMMENFYRFLRRHGLKATDRLLICDPSSALLKQVFELMGHSPVDIVEYSDHFDQPDATPPVPAYDAVLVMEYLECTEAPDLVFGRIVSRLRPGGLLVVHTPDAKSITLSHRFATRLHQPHRIHVLSRLILESLACDEGLTTQLILKKNYMDTFWPFINFGAFHELSSFGDGTLDAAIEFRVSHLRRAWWRWPHLLFWGFFGGILRDRSNLLAVFRKPGPPRQVHIGRV